MQRGKRPVKYSFKSCPPPPPSPPPPKKKEGRGENERGKKGGRGTKERKKERQVQDDSYNELVLYYTGHLFYCAIFHLWLHACVCRTYHRSPSQFLRAHAFIAQVHDRYCRHRKFTLELHICFHSLYQQSCFALTETFSDKCLLRCLLDVNLHKFLSVLLPYLEYFSAKQGATNWVAVTVDGQL